jgi:hypothetical protein
MAKKDLIKSFLDKVKKAFANDNGTHQEGNNDMNKKDKKELILKTLEKMGYSPEVDNDGDIMLHYQMKTIYVLTGDEEEPYISMMLPQFHEVEEGQETLVLAVCNKMTRELKLAKVYIDQTFKNVTATCEFYYANEESLEQNLRNSLKMLGVVRTVFRNNMAELADE